MSLKSNDEVEKDLLVRRDLDNLPIDIILVNVEKGFVRKKERKAKRKEKKQNKIGEIYKQSGHFHMQCVFPV